VPTSIRLLTTADAPGLEAFLSKHRDSSMFLRANARESGLEDRGALHHGTYTAAERDGGMVAVAAHYRTGLLALLAPEQCAAVAQACVAASGRAVTGLAGLPGQVSEARRALGLDHIVAVHGGQEWLYALDLAGLIVPPALASGTVVVRHPRADERDVLVAWRLAYDIELFGASDTAGQRQRSAAFLDAQIAAGHAWIALHEEQPVSLAAFNAALPDIVQLGGIYTPPDLRGRGFARAAVAAALLDARAHGVSRAVLFTNSHSAARSYEAVGFARTGDYALVLFRD
jgi:predicted GNAT family acetyltransferase